VYFRCTVLRNGFHRAPVYTLTDGTVVDRDTVKAGALASEFSEREDDQTVFNIKVSSIRSVK
jgi:hypothetical protein